MKWEEIKVMFSQQQQQDEVILGKVSYLPISFSFQLTVIGIDHDREEKRDCEERRDDLLLTV